MGFSVESYDLSELNRISVPGAVVPSLFWALPIGNWRRGELDVLWRTFTGAGNNCRDYGLLLVKDRNRDPPRETTINLTSLGGRLSDLVPGGAVRFLSPSALQEEPRRLLILSGGYPQPGWGVLVECPHERGIDSLVKHLVDATINSLCADDAAGARLDTFTEAAAGYHRWKEIQDAPVTMDMSSLPADILACEKIAALLSEGECALGELQFPVVARKLDSLRQAVGRAAGFRFDPVVVEKLESLFFVISCAASISSAPPGLIADVIGPRLNGWISDPREREAAYKEIGIGAAKDAMRACIKVRTKGLVDDGEDIVSWAAHALEQKAPQVESLLGLIRRPVEEQITAWKTELVTRERASETAGRRWKQQSAEAREVFHQAVARAVELQWNLGPQFLASFEKTCRTNGLWVRSIPWDPARMVGWKIWTSRVQLDVADLRVIAEEMAPGALGDASLPAGVNVVADGSFFTDYVHHIAISKPGFSPKAVTRELVSNLIRPAELRRLVGEWGGAAPSDVTRTILSEALLDAFGWKEVEKALEIPLAGCIHRNGLDSPVLAESVTGNDLRIVLESVCKDIVDVVVAQLGYSHSQLWAAIKDKVPTYRAKSHGQCWSKEVDSLTAGEATMLLRPLAPLAFPAKHEEINQFADALANLATLLNDFSHHREDTHARVLPSGKAAELVARVLAHAEGFLGELPWHLQVSFVYGEQPKVLSGEAWSHGSATRRLLRVIDWTGSASASAVTVWNKSRRNPIVPDPLFITRLRA